MGFTKANKTKDAVKLLAPTDGEVVALPDVPDPVFSAGTVGQGCGIRPASESVSSPLAGTVTMIAETGHAVGLTGTDGTEVLIHIGIDTVDMAGEGFVTLVEQGEQVDAGDPLIAFTRSAIHAAGHDDTVIMVLPSVSDPAQVRIACNGAVKTGEVLLEL